MVEQQTVNLTIPVQIGALFLFSLFCNGDDDLKRRELYHHGIQGQQWGKRNGPPYPLKKHSAAERKAALDKTKRKRYNKNKTIERGRYAVGSMLEKFGDKPVSEFVGSSAQKIKMLAKPESINEVLRNTNPTKSNNNCYNCVVAATARMCGIDVTARDQRPSADSVSFDDVCKVFNLNPDNPREVIRILNPDMDRLAHQIIKQYSDGDIGAIGLGWNDAYLNARNLDSTGHTLNWTMKNGEPLFIDTQVGAGNDILVPLLTASIDKNRELSVAKFGNINDSLNINDKEFWKFVK